MEKRFEAKQDPSRSGDQSYRIYDRMKKVWFGELRWTKKTATQKAQQLNKINAVSEIQ